MPIGFVYGKLFCRKKNGWHTFIQKIKIKKICAIYGLLINKINKMTVYRHSRNRLDCKLLSRKTKTLNGQAEGTKIDCVLNTLLEYFLKKTKLKIRSGSRNCVSIKSGEMRSWLKQMVSQSYQFIIHVLKCVTGVLRNP